MTDRYSIAAGLLLAVVIAIALFSDIGGDGNGTLGIDERPHRWPLPEFAVPVAAGELEGDANIAQDDCASSRVPCPEDAGRTPACQVDGEDAIRVCDLFDRPSLISFWFSKGGDCVDQQDVVDRVYARYRRQVRFLSLNVRDDRDTVRDFVQQRGWRMPVGYDRDGAVASLYRVGVCPTFAYVYPGGTLQSAGIGELSAPQLSNRIEALLRATRAAERG
jgi:thiol-disulfide isomerase/thioredoxin